MLERLRLWLAGLLAPELARRVAESPAADEADRSSMPVFAVSEESPLGLRGVERERSRKLEEVAEFLRELDPQSRDRIVAYARPRRTGRRQILTRCESQMDRWYQEHPNA